MCWCDSRKRQPWCDDCRHFAAVTGGAERVAVEGVSSAESIPDAKPAQAAAFDPLRRCDLLRQTKAEAAITYAMRLVEEMPGDPLLTDAVTLLAAARDSVADFVDGQDRRRFVSLDAPAPALPKVPSIMAVEITLDTRAAQEKIAAIGGALKVLELALSK